MGFEPTMFFRTEGYEPPAISHSAHYGIYLVGSLGFEPRLYQYQWYILTQLRWQPYIKRDAGVIRTHGVKDLQSVPLDHSGTASLINFDFLSKQNYKQKLSSLGWHHLNRLTYRLYLNLVQDSNLWSPMRASSHLDQQNNCYLTRSANFIFLSKS